jgi:hypothetical protein
VQQLPSHVQSDIATRVRGYIDIADAAGDENTLQQFAAAAAKEREEAIGQGIKSAFNQQWAASALAEAWCVAKLGLYTDNVNRHSASAVITAIEAFAPKRLACTKSRIVMQRLERK